MIKYVTDLGCRNRAIALIDREGKIQARVLIQSLPKWALGGCGLLTYGLPE